MILSASTQTQPYKGNQAQEEMKEFRKKKLSESISKPPANDYKASHSARVEKIASAIQIISKFVKSNDPRKRIQVAEKVVNEMLYQNPSRLRASKEETRSFFLKRAEKLLAETVIDDPNKSYTHAPVNDNAKNVPPQPQSVYETHSECKASVQQAWNLSPTNAATYCDSIFDGKNYDTSRATPPNQQPRGAIKTKQASVPSWMILHGGVHPGEELQPERNIKSASKEQIDDVIHTFSGAYALSRIPEQRLQKRESKLRQASTEEQKPSWQLLYEKRFE